MDSYRHIYSYITDNNCLYQSFFSNADYIHHYLYNDLVTLFSRSESNLRIRLLQNISQIYFHFYS